MIPVQSGFSLGEALFFTPFVLLGVAVLVFGAVMVYLDHKKEMALIESGQYADANPDSRAWILGGGLLVLALGLGSVVSAFLSGGAVGDGVTAVFVGLAALAYYFYKRRVVATTTV
ncbi:MULTISPECIES: hypothetical protein [Haloferax]|uniref:DUF3784 domain-containing protein n=1 Tax=Haloferax marinum TaxID=2666143 RepID=A0A6A8GD22_9EURY|nr:MULTISPECIES: hypothetical protein [Haloferax]KAB1198748.1 hypothetical protein Hfx1150_14945 [Haloferax sp. CBA1150]MRW97866.1 hypothetical protein [Haloferax marinum]